MEARLLCGEQINAEVVDHLREVLTRAVLEQIDEGAVHGLRISAGSYFTAWTLNSRAIVDIICQIVDEAVVNTRML